MKLAEALLLRSEYQKKINSLNQRILSNLKVQENDKPFEDPEALLEELMIANENLFKIVVKINEKNQNSKMEDGKTLSEVLAEREMLIKKIKLLDGIAKLANEKDFRLSHSEVKMNLTLDIGNIQKQIDKLSKANRELDALIQAFNWTTDLD